MMSYDSGAIVVQYCYHSKVVARSDDTIIINDRCSLSLILSTALVVMLILCDTCLQNTQQLPHGAQHAAKSSFLLFVFCLNSYARIMNLSRRVGVNQYHHARFTTYYVLVHAHTTNINQISMLLTILQWLATAEEPPRFSSMIASSTPLRLPLLLRPALDYSKQEQYSKYTGKQIANIFVPRFLLAL